MGLALGNLLSRTVTLKRGRVVADISAASKVLPKLASRIVTKAFPVNAHLSVLLGVEVEIEKRPTNPDMPQAHNWPTPERLNKLFGKLSLSGSLGWTDKERQEIKDLLTE